MSDVALKKSTSSDVRMKVSEKGGSPYLAFVLPLARALSFTLGSSPFVETSRQPRERGADHNGRADIEGMDWGAALKLHYDLRRSRRPNSPFTGSNPFSPATQSCYFGASGGFTEKSRHSVR